MEALKKIMGKSGGIEADQVLNALVDPLIVISCEDQIMAANAAAESFFSLSREPMLRKKLIDLVPEDSPVTGLVEQVREGAIYANEYGLDFGTPRMGFYVVDVQASHIAEQPGAVVISFRERSLARRIHNQIGQRQLWRSVTGMSAVLAHEIKNPLSGIRGAAQLLDTAVAEKDRGMARLIREEADRICAMVDRMEVFNEKPIQREAVNIHEVISHVEALATAGFGEHAKFHHHFDPSLPPVDGNRGQLVQIVLNLVKNGIEACPGDRVPEITLATAYRHGVRMQMPGSDGKVHMPLELSIEDNGAGIPEDMQAHLFDPFVSGKSGGSGLGLAVVAKMIGDHGGMIDFDTRPGKTVFRIRLPMHRERKQPK